MVNSGEDHSTNDSSFLPWLIPSSTQFVIFVHSFYSVSNSSEMRVARIL